MSRSNYGDDYEFAALWMGTVAAAIRGKRGQALLRELEAALLALPEKRLAAGVFAFSETCEVCALGAVAVKRRTDAGCDRIAAAKELEARFPMDTDASELTSEFDAAVPLLREITYINDEECDGCTQEQRYTRVLAWVRQKIKPAAEATA